MSEYHGSAHPSTFECVDDAPEYINSLSGNENGGLFYMIRPYCSSTGQIGHCPPYSTSYALTCVVCTK